MEGIQYSMRPQHFFSFNFRLLEAGSFLFRYHVTSLQYCITQKSRERAKDIRTDDRMLDLE